MGTLLLSCILSPKDLINLEAYMSTLLESKGWLLLLRIRSTLFPPSSFGVDTYKLKPKFSGQSCMASYSVNSEMGMKQKSFLSHFPKHFRLFSV